MILFFFLLLLFFIRFRAHTHTVEEAALALDGTIPVELCMQQQRMHFKLNLFFMFRQLVHIGADLFHQSNFKHIH